MPPPALFDATPFDLEHPEATREQIYAILPHRHEFMQLDSVVKLDTDRRIIVATRDVRADEWWCKGHLPGRPLLPGVLMIETAAHMCSYYYYRVQGAQRFLGFGGVEGFKFRESVAPPARILILGKAQEVKPRRVVCEVQGFVGQTMIFEGTIIGMPV